MKGLPDPERFQERLRASVGDVRIERPRIRLLLKAKQVGLDKHRSGWPYVMQHLRRFHHSKGILLDDFVERTFRPSANAVGWREPWIGIFHHPPNLPEWLDAAAPIQKLWMKRAFQYSLPYLSGAIALSEHLAAWLRTALPCPVLALKHPAEPSGPGFSMARWEKNKRLVQVGWYARNIRAIYQVDVPNSIRKVHLVQQPIEYVLERTDQMSPYRSRRWAGKVEVIPSLSNREYDEMMASSVILNEYWDVSASNTIVEAIARATPLIVNRHRALEEYLGRDYPLFFKDVREVRPMLQDSSMIERAHQHLLGLDKEWMSAAQFASSVAAFAQRVSRIRPAVIPISHCDFTSPSRRWFSLSRFGRVGA